MQSRMKMQMQCTDVTIFDGKDPTPQAHPTSHHQYPLFSSILPSPLLPIILRFPPLVPITNPLSFPNPSPFLFVSGLLGCGGKWVSMDSSSGVNVGRIGERICYRSVLFLHRWNGYSTRKRPGKGWKEDKRNDRRRTKEDIRKFHPHPHPGVVSNSKKPPLSTSSHESHRIRNQKLKSDRTVYP